MHNSLLMLLSISQCQYEETQRACTVWIAQMARDPNLEVMWGKSSTFVHSAMSSCAESSRNELLISNSLYSTSLSLSSRLILCISKLPYSVFPSSCLPHTARSHAAVSHDRSDFRHFHPTVRATKGNVLFANTPPRPTIRLCASGSTRQDI